MFENRMSRMSPEEYKKRGEEEVTKIEQKRAKMLEHTQHTDRNFKEYCAVFDIEPAELTGKIILDVGSGTKESFSKEAAKYGAKVVSLSPELRRWIKRKMAQSLILPDKKWQHMSVAARAQEMPFRVNTFDYVFASWSVPYYSLDPKDGSLSVEGMLKVLKPGGVLGMYPFSRQKTEDLEELVQNNDCTIIKEDHGVTMIKKNDMEETPVAPE